MNVSVAIIVMTLTFLSACRASELSLDRWIENNAIVVSSVDSPLSDAEIAMLDEALEGKRVVFLGEAAHWIHEKYDYRLRFLEYLVSKGFRHVGMEMGLSDGERIDRYMASGDSNYLDTVALYGYRSPTFRNRSPEEICTSESTQNLDFAEKFIHEEKRFYSQLRSIGERKLPLVERVRHFGFDVDTIPGGAYEDIEHLLTSHADNQTINGLLTLIAPVGQESISEEIARLKEALLEIETSRAEIQGVLDSLKLRTLTLSLKTLIESLEFQAIYLIRPCPDEDQAKWTELLMAAMAKRERAMFKIVREKLEELGPNEKIVLLGHNFHLSKEPKDLSFASAEVPSPYAPLMWPSIGEFISKVLKVPVYSVWMIHNRGYQSNITCAEIECPIVTGPGSLGEIFSRAGSVLSLRIPQNIPKELSPLDKRRSFSANGGTHSANLLTNADLVFFVDVVSGLDDRK